MKFGESYWLYVGDCKDFPSKGKMVITDAPHFNTCSTEDVIDRLNGFDVETFVVCKDETIVLANGTRLIQRKHEAFGGNLFEKMKFAAFYIEQYSEIGDTIIDPFCGYSSTGLAAVGLKRSYIGIDNKPEAIQESERILNGCS